MTKTHHSLAFDIALLANRLSLGLYFAKAGYGKVFGHGMDKWMEIFRSNQPPWLPGWFAVSYGYALPFVEMLVGLLLVLGMFSRKTAAVMSLMLVSFIIGASGLGHEHLPFHPNVLLLTLALLLAVTGAGRLSVDALRRK